MDSERPSPSRFGFTQHFEIEAWTDFVEVYWGADCQAAITPTGSREIGVAVLSGNPQNRLPEALKQMPVLAARLAEAQPTSHQQGAPCSLRRLPNICRGRIALVGDASGSVDPATGEGLGLSFQQALALSDAMFRGKIESYQAAHRKIGRRSYQMSQLLLLMDRHPRLRRAALGALAAEPSLFERMLKSNMGEPETSSVPAGALRLGWRMARLAWPF
jgi:flavin-dependent dehydrogenase